MGGDEPSHVSSHVAAARGAGIVPRELLEIKRQEGRREESARGRADTIKPLKTSRRIIAEPPTVVSVLVWSAQMIAECTESNSAQASQTCGENHAMTLVCPCSTTATKLSTRKVVLLPLAGRRAYKAAAQSLANSMAATAYSATVPTYQRRRATTPMTQAVVKPILIILTPSFFDHLQER